MPSLPSLIKRVMVSHHDGGVAQLGRYPSVEVVTVLDPNEKYVFDGMVTQLCADDPAFARRVDHFGHPRRRLRLALAVLLWTMTPFFIVFGGWTGLLLAVVASGYGAHLMTKRNHSAGDTPGFSWWPTRRRPGAAL